MKFSYVMLPDYPLERVPGLDQARRRAGLLRRATRPTRPGTRTSGCCSPLLPDRPEQVRFGPSVSAVVLREPTLIAQAAATLDELTNGRAEVVLSSGNFGLLAQYGIDWSKTKPLSRVKEGLHVDAHAARRRRDHLRRRVLHVQGPVHLRPPGAGAPADEDRRDARPEVVPGRRRDLRRLPPRAELHPRGVRVHRRAHADRRGTAGKNVDDLDIGAWVVFAVGEDSAVAKEAARSMVGMYASSMPDEQLAAQRRRRPTSSRRSSTRSAQATWPVHRRHYTGELAETAVGRRHAGGGAPRRSRPRSRPAGSTT